MAVNSSPFHVPRGSPVPDVTLPDLTARLLNLREYQAGQPLLVAFACNHCPYVRHIERALGEVVREFAAQGLRSVAISSNDVDQYPDDDAAGLAAQQDRAGWDFPYLMDTDQSAAKAFNAACTPDLFVYGADGRLNYRGAFDASTPKNGEPLTGELLRDALTRTLAGESVPEPHRPALGCGIKWKPGNEPVF